MALCSPSCVHRAEELHVKPLHRRTREGLPGAQSRVRRYIASTDVRHEDGWRCRNAWSGAPPERSIDRCLADATRRDPDFIALAFSGGGSRAAVFSAAVMFELRRHGILQRADVLSSASGGSVAAALYAASCDDAQDCPAAAPRPAADAVE
jgi:predicted acylesterase/phospholipase RssA